MAPRVALSRRRSRTDYRVVWEDRSQLFDRAVSGTTDFLPTFASLAGVELNPDIKIDGKDLSPLLKGETKESPHEAWHYYKGTKLMAVRSGPWKLALKPQSIGMGFSEQPGDIRTGGRLYNLDGDIGEKTDVATENPEIVQRLRKIADAMIADRFRPGWARSPSRRPR